jgi:hypothetical protein
MQREERTASGLATVLDTVVAPAAAFERLREAPTWGWAFAVAFALSALAFILEVPVLSHVWYLGLQHALATNSMYANVDPEQRQRMLAAVAHPDAARLALYVVISGLGLLVAVLLNTLILWAGSAVGGGDADFKRLWSASMNIAVPSVGIGSLVTAAVILLRGPAAFSSAADLANATLSPALLAPHAAPALQGILVGLGIFNLWGFALNVLALRVLAKASPTASWLFSAVILFGGAAFAAIGSASAAH